MHPRKRHLPAFTIVELLVVIGIIAILIGILVPVVSSVRKAAYVASSKSNIVTISNAIQRYHNDFLSYPGIWSNNQIAAGQTLTGGAGTITMTENCVLALCGGAANTAAAPSYVSTDLGKGPITYGTNPKRKAAYMEANNKILSMPGAGLDPGGYFGVGQGLAATYENTPAGPPGVPEFIDAFPQGLPIIYLRARVKATGVVGTGDHQYDARDLLPYVTYKAGVSNHNFAFDTTAFAANGTSDQANPGTYPTSGGTAYSGPNFAGSYNYFRNAATNAARNADGYLLISPGEDRRYGTSDDICNFTF